MAAREVITKFGGQTALSKLLGINQSAVAYWVKRGVIPSKWHMPLMDVARKNGVPLDASDFIDTSPSINTVDTKTTVLETSLGDKTQLLNSSVDDVGSDLTVQNSSHFLFYASGDGTVKVQVILGDETVWASQKGIAEIFGVDRTVVTKHLQNIFGEQELIEAAVCAKFAHTAEDGKTYDTNFYSLDAIISVGYRVSSYKATQFRKWATTVLRGYLIKGFALDDDRLKQANQLFGKDYFDELLERIREIRASERRFYQKITDIYSQCSIDYDKDSPVSQQFYAHVQDKLHYAIHGHTSAELIQLRADASKPNMGLYSYKNEKLGGKITKLDVTVGKNYLDEKEIDNLNRLVSMYLDFAENFARRQIPMKMEDWAEKLDGFLRFNAYDVLDNYGTIRRDVAEKRALSEYEKFRAIQDKKFKSDFDKIVDEVKTKKRLPRE